MPIRERIREALTTHWPVKLTALVLSGLLWAVTAAEEPTTQLVPVSLTIEPPPGRALTTSPPQVQALYEGPARELIKLFAATPSVSKEIPDTVTGSSYTVELSPQDLDVSIDAAVQLRDIQPRMIDILLDDVSRRTVPVVARARLTPDSGFVVAGLTVRPGSLTVSGPRAQVEQLDRLYTERIDLRVDRPMRRVVPIDTAGVGVLDLSSRSVELLVDVSRVAERVIMGVPVRVRGRSGWNVSPPAIAVAVRGSERRIEALTRDSVRASVTPLGDSAQTLMVDLDDLPDLDLVPRPDSVTAEPRPGA